MNNYKFTGYERDAESNLDNAQARYYSSSMGRFMSPDPYNAGADPMNPQSWNMYSYVNNNPLSNIDPYGLDCLYFNEDTGSLDSIVNTDPGVDCGAGAPSDEYAAYIDGTYYNIEGGHFSYQVEYCPYAYLYTQGMTSCSPENYAWVNVSFSNPNSPAPGSPSGCDPSSDPLHCGLSGGPGLPPIGGDGSSGGGAGGGPSTPPQKAIQPPTTNLNCNGPCIPLEAQIIFTKIGSAFPDWTGQRYLSHAKCNALKAAAATSLLIGVGAPASAPVTGPVGTASGLLLLAGCPW